VAVGVSPRSQPPHGDKPQRGGGDGSTLAAPPPGAVESDPRQDGAGDIISGPRQQTPWPRRPRAGETRDKQE